VLFRIIALVVLLSGVAAADPPTVVTGRVTDVLGRPVSNARVYVLPRADQPHQTKTNKDGRYSVEVDTTGTHGVVIAIDKAHVFRTVLVQQGTTNTLDIDVELDTQGGEVIKIEDKKRPQPAQKPKPTKDTRMSLPYSDESIERDAWARAWLLLDVDERGRVTRLKLLKKPGFDLDAIAIKEAFALQFDPARDAQGRPMKTYVLWTMEWPSWGWLVQGNGTTVRRPRDVDEMHALGHNLTGLDGTESVRGEQVRIGGNWAKPLATATSFPHALARVPCAGSGPLNLDLRNRAYRDCSEPDLRDAEALPWITPETAETAIAELKAADLKLELSEVVEPGSPVPGIVSTAVTATVYLALTTSFLKYRRHSESVRDNNWKLTVDADAYYAQTAVRDKWAKISVVLAGAAIVSTGVTLFMWNRNQSKRSFSVQPTSASGASASFGMSF
jgi:hypothetical protein